MEPLTPTDCDLRDFAFMPLDATRLLDSDLFALSSGDEFKAALALWCKCWLQVPAASLPNDDRVLAHLSGAGSKWRKVKDMALRGFVLCSDGRLYHPVVAEKANDAWARKASYRDRSRKGNAKRWGSQKDEQEQSKSDPLAIPEGVLERPKGQGQGQGQGQEENEKKNHKGGFAFDGAVIRLRRDDFDRWQNAYVDIDLMAVLQSRDDWLKGQPEPERKRWFNSTSNFLAKKQQEAKAAAKKADTYAYPIA